MLFRVGIAVFLSFILIGGATWVRVSNQKSPTPTLIGVESSNTEGTLTYEDTYWPDGSGKTSGGEEGLATTDLISRQLMSDFINLTGSGQASGGDIVALAEKYANLIPSLTENSDETLSVSDLTIVQDSPSAYQKYDMDINVAYATYTENLSGMYEDEEVFADEGQLYEYMTPMQDTYTEIARVLSKIPVPNSIASTHVKLVNHYLSIENILTRLSDETGDPTIAMADLIALREQMPKETEIIKEINSLLATYEI